MADQKQLDILKQGVVAWNEWRGEHLGVRPDLIGANLRGAKLNNANFSHANLSHATLSAATLYRATLSSADLSTADLSDVNLRAATLSHATLNNATLSHADLGNATVGYTSFVDVDLSVVKNLETVRHQAPSSIGIDTIYRSQGKIPEAFLRGAGVPDSFLEYMRSLVGNPIDYYSCFISYSSKDQAFAERLYADLQSKGVRCWYAPEDMDIGDKIRPRIEESIRLYDKLLLVLSEYSIASHWVAYEVERALNKEPQGKPNVLYPIRVDDAIMETKADWADDIKSTRHIGDFTLWKNHDDYQKAFDRLLRALKAK